MIPLPALTESLNQNRALKAEIAEMEARETAVQTLLNRGRITSQETALLNAGSYCVSPAGARAVSVAGYSPDADLWLMALY
jgi:hypothetical protein